MPTKTQTKTTYETHKVETEIRGHWLTLEFWAPQYPPITQAEADQICKELQDHFRGQRDYYEKEAHAEDES